VCKVYVHISQPLLLLVENLQLFAGIWSLFIVVSELDVDVLVVHTMHPYVVILGVTWWSHVVHS